jgi:hypothetical protein
MLHLRRGGHCGGSPSNQAELVRVTRGGGGKTLTGKNPHGTVNGGMHR